MDSFKPSTNAATENSADGQAANEETKLLDASRELLDSTLSVTTDAGNWLANYAKNGNEQNPEAQAMLQNFGIGLADGAQKIKESIEPPAPSNRAFRLPGEGHTQFPMVQERLRQAGIDPGQLNGIKIGILDTFTKNGESPSHGEQVRSVIADPDQGLIREDGVIPLESRVLDTPNDQKPIQSRDFVGKPNGLTQYISELSSRSLDKWTQKINQISAPKENSLDPAIRVISLSQGLTNTDIYKNVFGTLLHSDPEEFRPWLNELMGQDQAKQWIETLKSKEETEETVRLDTQLLQAIQKTVDNELATNPQFQAAQDSYRQATKQLVERNISLVVATGNEQTAFPQLNLLPGAAYNWCAQSDHVIGVGSCNINRTPEDRTDDYLSGFSSHGNKHFYPAVLAQGENVPSKWQGIDGTSFATPQVAATVGLMLAQNPKLSFSEIKTMLKQSSSLLRGEYTQAQGAGILRIEDAVIAAKKGAK